MVIPSWVRVTFFILVVGWIAWRPTVQVLVDWLWFDSVGPVAFAIAAKSSTAPQLRTTMSRLSESELTASTFTGSPVSD